MISKFSTVKYFVLGFIGVCFLIGLLKSFLVWISKIL
jgi:hypothetical protein